jgi:tRNA threonylcarbamoyladenosine biosynthesis protein TsaB
MNQANRQIDHVLGLDCSAGALSCAVLSHNLALGERSRPLARGHGEAIMGELAAVMAEAGLGFDRLDAIAVTEGPGSFTGIRVGLAAARGLGLALSIPVLGVSCFEAIASATPTDGAALMIVIDSRRTELFVQSFDSVGIPLGEPFLATGADLIDHLPAGRVIVTGDAAQAIGALPNRAILLPSGPPSAVTVARLATARHLNGSRQTAAPLYIRAPDAIVPAQGGRIR